MQPMNPPPAGYYPPPVIQQMPQGYTQPGQYPAQPGYGYAPPQGYGYGYGAAAMGPKRNVALLTLGSIALAIGLLSFIGFAYNAYQYATVEERFADLAGASWIVEMVKEADLHRMMVFGPIALVFGTAGLVMGGFGLKKK
jgi:hypothetical protein